MRKIHLKVGTAVGISLLSLSALASPSHAPASALPATGTYSEHALLDRNTQDGSRIGNVLASNESNYNDTTGGMN